jgi:2-dehydro-3-deoxy-D-arabinonate dehydratase
LKETPVIPNHALCRFSQAGSERLGLIMKDHLYDITGRYGSFAGWLKAAAGRTLAALSELSDTPALETPIGLATALEDGMSGMVLLPPLDLQEVWAFGVTYEMSREARMRESNEPTIYGKVYEAPRPEIFFKATPHRVVGTGAAVGIRADSTWNVPEAELTIVMTPALEIIGYTIGNDMSSRDIEGQNPLYLPQAKVYNRCCALGPFIRLAEPDFNPLSLAVSCVITRHGEVVFTGHSNTNHIHRALPELANYLGRCNSFPNGVLGMTGTGIVPPDTFTLRADDIIEITFDGLGTLVNPVVELPVN